MLEHIQARKGRHDTTVVRSDLNCAICCRVDVCRDVRLGGRPAVTLPSYRRRNRAAVCAAIRGGGARRGAAARGRCAAAMIKDPKDRDRRRLHMPHIPQNLTYLTEPKVRDRDCAAAFGGCIVSFTCVVRPTHVGTWVRALFASPSNSEKRTLTPRNTREKSWRRVLASALLHRAPSSKEHSASAVRWPNDS